MGKARELAQHGVDLFNQGDMDGLIATYTDDAIEVFGEVAHPGAVAFQSTERITLLTAIARAGGLTDRASRKIQIKRRDRTGRDLELEVDFKRIVAGKDSDFQLQSGDVVIVKESFF